MKKFLTALTTFIAVLACCLCVACHKEPQTVTADENTVIITASDTSFNYDNKTLKDYMDFLQEGGKLSYSIDSGMVTSINGKSNTKSSYWMLYTSDAENANDAWGTFEHQGVLYGSAVLGAESLAVKEGCTYIWAYQTF